MQAEQGVSSGQAAKKAAYVKDPLLSRSTKLYGDELSKVADRAGSARKVYRVTSIVVVSMACYVFTLFLFFKFYYSNPATVLALTFITLISSLAEPIFVTIFFPTRGWRKWIGRLSSLMTLAAMLVGLLIHYTWLVFYEHYKSMQTATNVAASENALQFEDAGSLIFSADAVVDIQRSVGYRDAKTDTTLCVAPVVDSQMETEDPVGFFAVGVGCCGWRGSFSCDDVADADAKGGMLLLTPKSLVSPIMSWTVDRAVDFEAYDEAIRLESVVFGTTVAKNTRLLRWVKDVSKTADKYKESAFVAACVAVVVALVINIFLAVASIYEPFKSKKKEKYTIV